MISSHVQITCYLHMWKDHHCCGYTINCTFYCKKLWKWKGLVFHWCLYNKQNITWPLKDTKFLFLCWKIFNSFVRSLVKYFSTLKEKFRISAWPCNILIHARVQPQRFHLKGHHRISSTDLEIKMRIHPLTSEMSQSTRRSECRHALFYR